MKHTQYFPQVGAYVCTNKTFANKMRFIF